MVGAAAADLGRHQDAGDVELLATKNADSVVGKLDHGRPLITAKAVRRLLLGRKRRRREVNKKGDVPISSYVA
ncbi:hypothetical protein HPP92_011848 [Vanilla planifolia]|uniref:Uncharacterized protein n=1 Tax=Vanilla planifolia TaxID=51239 RepID=A0A835R3Q3_VANPL|nr:hypothetical protein HPP92_011848 [Vanilla planifolia]